MITRDQGRELDPDLALDGRHLVYTSDALGNSDIWIRQLASGRSVPLTEDYGGSDESAALSPDGEWIAFVSDRQGGGVFLLPRVGGSPRRIAELRVLAGSDTSLWVPTLAWHPAGDRLVVSGTEDAPQPSLAYPDGSPPLALPLADLPSGAAMVEPALSPDGRWLAMVELAGVGTTVTRLWLAELDALVAAAGSEEAGAEGGKAPAGPEEGAAESPWHALTSGSFHDDHPFWGSDPERLFFVSDRGGPRDIWWLGLDSRGHARSEAEPFTTGVGVGSASFSGDGGLLVYSKVESTSNLWTLALPSGTATFADASPFTAENHLIEFVDLSPSGERIVFDSNRGGNADLWWMPA
ncbi:MAG: hypothetical protein MI919_21185, partial [Holophagales bacterium]|nr:hypothetical protein [Holophagales bacterium]